MRKLRHLSRPFALICLMTICATALAAVGDQLNLPINEPAAESQTADEVGDLIRSGLALFRQGKPEEALILCAKAAALDPKDFRPHILTGMIYTAQNKLQAASNEYAEAIRLQPGKKELYLLKAEVDYYLNAHAAALAASRKAIEIDPNFAEAWAMIGKLLREDKKRLPEVIAAFRTALRINPKIPSLYDDLAEALESADDKKGAEAVLRQGMAADPDHMAGRFNLGRMLVEQGRLKEARELWEGRKSDSDTTMPRLIDVLTWAENVEQAKKELAKSPNNPDTLINMGLAIVEGPSWVIDDRQDRALGYLKKALKLEPKNARAQTGIVKAYIQIADRFDEKTAVVDRELAKLRQIDAKLADEMEAYRKSYRGGFDGPAGPAGPAQ